MNALVSITTAASVDPAHEAKCRRCGAACHAPIDASSKFIIPEIHCKFLGQRASGKYFCTVYDRRFEMAPWCESVHEALQVGGLAHDCPYAAGLLTFAGKIWATGRDRERLVAEFKRLMVTRGLPTSTDPDAALELLGEGWKYTEMLGRFVFTPCPNTPSAEHAKP